MQISVIGHPLEVPLQALHGVLMTGVAGPFRFQTARGQWPGAAAQSYGLTPNQVMNLIQSCSDLGLFENSNPVLKCMYRPVHFDVDWVYTIYFYSTQSYNFFFFFGGGGIVMYILHATNFYRFRRTECTLTLLIICSSYITVYGALSSNKLKALYILLPRAPAHLYTLTPSQVLNGGIQPGYKQQFKAPRVIIVQQISLRIARFLFMAE